MRARWFVVLLLAATLATVDAGAQEFRGTMRGRVMDPSGLGVSGVTVTATHQDTSTAHQAVTSDDGTYTAAYLAPGRYVVAAEHGAFGRFLSEPLDVPLGGTVSVDIVLPLGTVSERVAVVETSLDAGKADRGFTIDEQQVSELPLSGRNPFMLSALAPGITYNGQAIFQRPFDNGAIADWSINGGLNRNNDFLLDGAPNNAIHAGNNIAYVPPVEAVREFRIVTNGYDAQYGRTGGGVVNVSLKSGSNALHGTVYEFARRSAWDATSFLTNARGSDEKGHYLDQYGFELDGPLRLGRLYDGRGRTFFMVSFEGYREGTPTPLVLTVPDEAQRRGDFSNLRDAAGNLIVIYDPATGRLENGRWVRDPFPGNVIPAARINPVAERLLAHYPLPNTSGAGSDPWRNNFVHAPNLARDRFRNFVTKIDHVFSPGHRVFARYATNRRTEQRHRNGITTGPAQDGQNPLTRSNQALVADWLRAVSGQLLVNARVSANRYVNDVRVRDAAGFDVAALGLPAALGAQFREPLFPRVNLADYSPLGRGTTTRLPTTVAAAQPNVTWIHGASSLKAGVDARLTWYAPEESGFPAMRLEFNRGFTQRVYDQADPTSGNAVASLLLGAPGAGVVDWNSKLRYHWWYYAPWLQHDWRVSDRLTLNLGMRWDLSAPVSEREDRLNRGFDAQRGTLRFLAEDLDTRAAHRFDWNNVQPRIGAAVILGSSTVLRGGFGRFFLNPTTVGTSHGYSIQTALAASRDGNRTSVLPLSNPFPDGITAPPGSALGASTLLGRSPSFSNPSFVVPSVDQFSIAISRDLPWATTVEAAYVGSRTRDAATSWPGFNEPDLAFRARCDPTSGGDPAFCNERLPNPYRGVAGFEGTPHFTSATLSRYDLARPHPQFAAFSELDRNDGRVWYDALQATARKRLSSNISFSATYTLSRTVEEMGFRDDVARGLDRSPAPTDRPHRVTLSAIYLAPVMTGRLARILNDWTIAGTLIAQSGRPWDLPAGLAYVRDAGVEPDGTSRYVRGVRPCVAQISASGALAMLPYSQAAGCQDANFIVLPPYTGRTAPFRDDALRLPGFRQIDVAIARTLSLTSSLRLQLRAEIFNLLNEPAYDERQYVSDPFNSSFGAIDRDATAQSNFPRHVQLAAKLFF
jgi:hypothetical protein